MLLKFELIKVHTVRFQSIEIPIEVFGGFDNVFHVYLMRGFQKYENGFLSYLQKYSQFSPSGSMFLPCLSLPSKSHCQNSISSIFLESPHIVDMKNVVKSSQTLFWVFQYSTSSHCTERKRVGSCLMCFPSKQFFFLRFFLT